jgi:hypothetical protein
VERGGWEARGVVLGVRAGIEGAPAPTHFR